MFLIALLHNLFVYPFFIKTIELRRKKRRNGERADVEELCANKQSGLNGHPNNNQLQACRYWRIQFLESVPNAGFFGLFVDLIHSE